MVRKARYPFRGIDCDRYLAAVVLVGPFKSQVLARNCYMLYRSNYYLVI